MQSYFPVSSNSNQTHSIGVPAVSAEPAPSKSSTTSITHQQPTSRTHQQQSARDVNLAASMRGALEQQTSSNKNLNATDRAQQKGAASQRASASDKTSPSSSSSQLTLGTYGKHKGIFIGEVHDQRDTMSAFHDAIPSLAGKVDVILLEYYPKGDSPQGKRKEEIEQDLLSFDKGFGIAGKIAEETHKMCMLAARHGIDVRGIDVSTPNGSERGVKYFQWRLSEKCNQAFLDGSDEYAKEKGKDGISFCMYGGLVHWVKIKKLASKIPGYRINDGKFGQI